MTGTHALPGARVRGALLPLAGAAVLAAVDVVNRAGPWNIVASGVLDECAHLLTAALLWGALRPRRPRPGVLPWVLIGSVVIDLDHLPLYLGHPRFLIDGGRPPTHSLTTIAALALLAVATGRYRSFGATAIGGLLHFVRDLATGPGLPLGWPLFDVSVRIPFPVYAAIVTTAALVAAVRRLDLPPAPSRLATGATSDG